MLTKEHVQDIIDELIGSAPPPGDASGTSSILQVEVGDTWIPATPEVWRAWSGRRSVWGTEYHGPVYALGAPEEVPWDGSRICSCPKCQEHVRPTLKYN